jgi:hypothetical protein
MRENSSKREIKFREGVWRIIMARKKITSWLFLGILATGLFVGCKSAPVAPVLPDPPPPVPQAPPPLRPLSREIFKRIANPMALQYYISSWVILNYDDIPDYPASIGVQSFPNVSAPPYASVPNRIDVNPQGTAQLSYDSLDRVILIKEQTRGALLSMSDDGSILDICFEPNNESTLTFKLDDFTGYYFLEQANGMRIQYGDIVYTQWIQEMPLLLVRMEENVERTIQAYTVSGRTPSFAR